jgi:hypothetical protein
MLTHLIVHRKANRKHHDHNNSDPVSHVAQVLLPLLLEVGPGPAATIAIGRNGLGRGTDSFEVLDGRRQRDCGGGGREGHGSIDRIAERGVQRMCVWEMFDIYRFVCLRSYQIHRSRSALRSAESTNASRIGVSELNSATVCTAMMGADIRYAGSGQSQWL